MFCIILVLFNVYRNASVGNDLTSNIFDIIIEPQNNEMQLCNDNQSTSLESEKRINFLKKELGESLNPFIEAENNYLSSTMQSDNKTDLTEKDENLCKATQVNTSSYLIKNKRKICNKNEKMCKKTKQSYNLRPSINEISPVRIFNTDPLWYNKNYPKPLTTLSSLKHNPSSIKSISHYEVHDNLSDLSSGGSKNIFFKAIPNNSTLGPHNRSKIGIYPISDIKIEYLCVDDSGNTKTMETVIVINDLSSEAKIDCLKEKKRSEDIVKNSFLNTLVSISYLSVLNTDMFKEIMNKILIYVQQAKCANTIVGQIIDNKNQLMSKKKIYASFSKSLVDLHEIICTISSVVLGIDNSVKLSPLPDLIYICNLKCTALKQPVINESFSKDLKATGYFHKYNCENEKIIDLESYELPNIVNNNMIELTESSELMESQQENISFILKMHEKFKINAENYKKIINKKNHNPSIKGTHKKFANDTESIFLNIKKEINIKLALIELLEDDKTLHYSANHLKNQLLDFVEQLIINLRSFTNIYIREKLYQSICQAGIYKKIVNNDLVVLKMQNANTNTTKSIYDTIKEKNNYKINCFISARHIEMLKKIRILELHNEVITKIGKKFRL